MFNELRGLKALALLSGSHPRFHPIPGGTTLESRREREKKRERERESMWERERDRLGFLFASVLLLGDSSSGKAKTHVCWGCLGFCCCCCCWKKRSCRRLSLSLLLSHSASITFTFRAHLLSQCCRCYTLSAILSLFFFSFSFFKSP